MEGKKGANVNEVLNDILMPSMSSTARHSSEEIIWVRLRFVRELYGFVPSAYKDNSQSVFGIQFVIYLTSKTKLILTS